MAHHPTTLRVVAPPPALFAAGLVAGVLLDRVVPLGTTPAFPLIGVPLAVVGAAIAGWAVVSFRRARTTILPRGRARHLVPGGPYRFSRNPMYLGMLLVYVGIAAWMASWWSLVVLPVVLVVLHRGVIRREEAHLEAVFGDPYRAYKRRVRRWV